MPNQEHIVICPLNEELLSCMRELRVVIDVERAEDVVRVHELAQRFHLHLYAIRLRTDDTLADLEPRQDWQDLPLAVYVDGMGAFSALVVKLPRYRALNLRVHLAPGRPGVCRDARILASLGIAVTVSISVQAPWEDLEDLAAYALLGPVAHAPVEPFEFLLENYRPTSHTNFGRVSFDDPSRYLYSSAEGRIALSEPELADGAFVLDEVSGIDSITDLPAYRDRLSAWRDVFLDFEGCGACPGWRVCMGCCRGDGQDLSGCRAFFSELLETLEQAQTLQSGKPPRWRY